MLTVAERETRKIRFDHGYTREVVIRELSPEEVAVMVDVLEVAVRVFPYRVAKHDREEFISFLNEEAYLLACKWDGQGGLRNLGGYIYRNLELNTSNFRKTSLIREMNFTSSPEMTNYDEEENIMYWEHISYATNDEYSLDGYDKLFKDLTPDQNYILDAIYNGQPIKSIAEHLGRSAKHVFNERDRIRDRARKFFGEGYGNGYARRKNAKKGR